MQNSRSKIVKPVLNQHRHMLWPKVSGYFSDAVSFSGGEYTLDQVKLLICQGYWELFVVVENDKVIGAASVEFINQPNDRVAFITSMGGRNVTENHVFDQLKSLVKNMGATKIRAMARDELLRLYSRCELHKKYNVVESDI